MGKRCRCMRRDRACDRYVTPQSPDGIDTSMVIDCTFSRLGLPRYLILALMVVVLNDV
jgi:hypothetical protein